FGLDRAPHPQAASPPNTAIIKRPVLVLAVPLIADREGLSSEYRRAACAIPRPTSCSRIAARINPRRSHQAKDGIMRVIHSQREGLRWSLRIRSDQCSGPGWHLDRELHAGGK